MYKCLFVTEVSYIFPKVLLFFPFLIGTRTKLNPPDGVYFQWAERGSYRLEQMLETIKHLPNRHNLFTMKNYAIYVLDNYAVHLMPEIRKE